MKKNILTGLFALFFILQVTARSDSYLKLWYDKPAKQWVEALPLGNGRLGAMVFGDPEKEVIQLNENTVWAGSPNRNDSPETKEELPEVRKLIFEGKYREAQDLVNRNFFSHTSDGMPYQPVGNLRLSFPGHADYSGYNRELDIEKALATTHYTVNGVHYTSTVFASYPDQVIVARISADKPGSVTFSAGLDRPKSKVNISTKGTTN